MSEEMGADALTVALIQYIRLLLVVLLLPATASLLFPVNPGTQTAATVAITNNLPSLPIILNLLVVAVCGGLGVWGGRRLRLPSSGFLGSISRRASHVLDTAVPITGASVPFLCRTAPSWTFYWGTV
jgi:uncharacterized membrane protein AbrB (regulator of aidB expression)